MSSDGSVSTSGSRIRQFGLYRTIDARTEEFLRLSRKRQLKQGCACAAVSTAVTVIIVISIILVYEYSTISESGRRLLSKPSWLGLMNASTDTVFDPKLNKAKINLDSASIQLLPLLLRTLKQSGFYDKITEDYPNPSSSSEKKDATEPYEKNVFSDTRNWMRMPISRLYAIEYKTSPIVYIKNPTRKNDYFTKIRKIRDYQRMLNYVDKMISEKVAYGSTQQMHKSDFNLYANRETYTTPMTRTINYKNSPSEGNEIKDEKGKVKKQSCVCPQKIGQLLTKLIASLQKLLPDFTNNKTENLPPCVTENAILKHKVISKPQAQKKKSSQEEIVKADLITILKQTSTIQTPIKSINYLKSLSNIDSSVSKIMNLLRPKIKNLYWDKNRKINDTEYTSKHNNIKFSNKFDSNSVVPLTSTSKAYVYSEGDYIYIKNKFNKTSKDVEHSTIPIYSEDDYEVDTETTTNAIQNFNFLDAHSLELVKKKYLSSRTKDIDLQMKNDSLISIVHDYNYNNTLETPTTYNISNNRIDDTYVNENNSISIMTTTVKFTTEKYTENKPHLKEKKIPDAKIVDKYPSYHQQEQIDDVTLEEEFEKALTENPEDSIKTLELMINSLNTTRDTHKDLIIYKSNSLDSELLKNVKHLQKSMIPRNRPSYLEMQRSDWKRDDIHDYDTTNNYLFE